MKKHLKTRHQIIVEKALSKNQVAVNKQMRQLYQQARANSEREEFDTKILEACLDTSVITRRVEGATAQTGQPLSSKPK
jgi:hypothetical protein